MSNLTHGMALREVEELAQFLQLRAADLHDLSAGIDRRVRASSWAGPDADRFRSDRWPLHRTAFAQVARELDRLGQEAAAQAVAQRRVSTDGGRIAVPERRGAAVGSSSATDGRGYLAGLLTGMSSVEPGHIRVVHLVDGSVVVVLPGVEDLSRSGEAGVDGARRGGLIGALFPGFLPNPLGPLGGFVGGAAMGFVGGALGEAVGTHGSSRDLRYTAPTALDPASRDRYAQAVREALEREGVAPGAQVLLVGHSGGAYAAASLAADGTFNQQAGQGGAYDVTHVVAAGADTDQFLARVPNGTGFLVLNNRGDLVSQAERLTDVLALRGDATAEGATHHEEWFSAGSMRGAGHGIENYAGFLAGPTGSPDLDAFAAQIDLRYGGSPVDRTTMPTVADQ